jgi:hypothetical protein
MDPNLFFPKRGGGQRKAKMICDDCVVRTECGDYAERTNTRYGIWGGEVLKRWGNSVEVDDPDDFIEVELGPPNSFVISDDDLGDDAFPLVIAGRAFPALDDLQVEVHAIDCDLDEDCSCHVALESYVPTGTVTIVTISRDDLPLCPPD